MSSFILRSGTSQAAYPERREPRHGRLEEMCVSAAGTVNRRLKTRQLRLRRLVRAVGLRSGEFGRLGPHGVRDTAHELRLRLRSEGLTIDAVSWVFALVREAAGRTVGMRHFDVQVMGGWVLLNRMIAEMDTGEGKTLTATLPACTAALMGVPVHIITVNDYLAERDAEWMQPIYSALGLKVGVIRHGMDPEARRAAYASDVTYCTNKEVAFDYLKDRIVLGRNASPLKLQLERAFDSGARLRRLLLRGLSYAIVDEADSVLVDEARTPLIIAGATNAAPDGAIYETALSLARQLRSGRDFLTEGRQRTIRLTPRGQERLGNLAGGYEGLWSARRRREELVCQALTALHLMQCNKHYLLKDRGVQIIDEYTGRVLADRQWEYGLHQMVETKEGCEVTSPNESLARISYQRFFRRYLYLAGMTGTAREVQRELWSVYQLPVVRIPTNRPVKRRFYGKRMHRSTVAKWTAVVASVTAIHQGGRPVLVGTRSVEASEHLSCLLNGAKLPHRVLNARHDSAEAEVIARAGERGVITVATNMAGRGTDIRLERDVAELGGLHVIATEGHEARRIDRQLFGRCGRQGDPGSYEMIVCVDDELMAIHAGRVWRWLTRLKVRREGLVVSWLAGLSLRRAQVGSERLHSRMRRDLLKQDELLENALAFSGRFE